MDKPASPYPLGQPVYSNKAYTDYMAWKHGDKYWSLLASSFMGELHGGIAARADDMVLAKLLDKEQAEEDSQDPRWVQFEPGKHEMVFKLEDNPKVNFLFARFLSYAPDNIGLPKTISLFVSKDGISYKQIARKSPISYPNNKHDAWIEGLLFEDIGKCRYVKFEFEASCHVYLDEVLIYRDSKIAL